MRGEGGWGDTVCWGRAGGGDQPCHLSDNHHRDRAAGRLQDGNCLVVVDVDTCDRVDGDDLVVDPEASLVSRAPSSDPRDENTLVVPLERSRAKPSGDAQPQTFVCSRKRDLFRHLQPLLCREKQPLLW